VRNIVQYSNNKLTLRVLVRKLKSNFNEIERMELKNTNDTKIQSCYILPSPRNSCCWIFLLCCVWNFSPDISKSETAINRDKIILFQHEFRGAGSKHWHGSIHGINFSRRRPSTSSLHKRMFVYSLKFTFITYIYTVLYLSSIESKLITCACMASSHVESKLAHACSTWLIVLCLV
jgi:hypothetical protein